MQRTLSTFLALTILLAPAHTLAATADECRARVNTEVARELRLYRAYLFGKELPEDAPTGDVRYDTAGRAWLKTDNESTPWINSVNVGHALGWKWDNAYMLERDEHSDALPIKGIFETKRVLTSELIPYMLQSIRALDCRLETLCEVARRSEDKSDDDPVDIGTVQPIGCIAFEDTVSWPECHFDAIQSQADARSYCDDITTQLMQREAELLKLVVEYDAGFRSLLQFAGNFDIFLRELRWPLTGTLRQAVQLIGQLERIPCFLSSCDTSPEF